MLALAYRDMEPKPAYSKDDERDLVLRGYVAFLDPPKETAEAAIAALQEHGVAVKVLTGDNELVSRKICREVGIATDQVLLGTQVEGMSDAELAEAAEKATLFARLSPAHKQRIIKALQGAGHVVGFHGRRHQRRPGPARRRRRHFGGHGGRYRQGIGGRHPAGKRPDGAGGGRAGGAQGFRQHPQIHPHGGQFQLRQHVQRAGRQHLPAVRADGPDPDSDQQSALRFFQVPIPTDNVDPEQIAKPRPWSMGAIARFILFIGPCSSIFDYTTFFIMLYVFECWDPANASLFQTGWFVESLLTQTLIIHVIRTNRIPFLQSWASWPLIVTTSIIMMLGVWLPFSPLGPILGFTPLPALYWPLIVVTLFCYVALTQTVKMWLLRKGWVAN